ncbi:MAG: ATP-binding cassette domain-containing protein [Verrucomicrobiia bacterium]
MRESVEGEAGGASPQLVVRNLGLERGGRWLFRGVNVEIPRGKFVAVAGPSGVGKTSFLSVIAGLVEPTEGEVVYWCGEGCQHRAADFHKRIGMVFQNFRLAFNSSVLENVLCGRLGRYRAWQTVFGFPRRDREEAFRLLYDLGLGGHTHRWVAEVSGGEQQRTAVARALFQEPEVLLADEPVSNLDAYLAGRVLGRLKIEAGQRGRTVICVLHTAEHIARFADWVLSFDPIDPGGWKLRENATGGRAGV